ncbi:DNRLRE domain-containing protein [Arthrobacter sp. zg-Y411]|uniref:CBM96 family carbohydrate-binding protein n=1 Tax=Arthrobacter zhangbolii TaxID=2886936 RepID=UPI001D158DA7|nr:LamG-like jellyroll fold domain-containing protein [Arthrobacter zhangbolii]MCC3295303.1 DNRLRE domain-containing protein [Arthrobacter zhangbolii]
MRKSIAALLTVTALTATALAATAPPASAISPGVAFSASDLPTWQTNGIVWGLAQANGTVYAGGTFTAIRPPGAVAGGAGTRSAVNFAAFDAYTGNPTSCNLSVTGTSATVRALDVSPDGRTLYIGGSFSSVNGVSASSIAAINLPGCTVNTNFRPGGVSATVRAIDATNEAIYFGGDFRSVRNTPRERLAAVTPTGALLPWAPAADLPVRALHVPPAKNVVITGGDFTTMNGADSKALAVVDPVSGSSIRTYPRFFIPRTSVVKTITSDETSFYIGNEGTGGGVFDGRARLDLGTYDQVWRDTCLGATQALDIYQHSLYAAHHAHDCGSMGSFTDGSRIHLSAQNVDAPSPMMQWNPLTNDGQGEGIGPRALAHTTVGSNDVLWVGGEFTTTNGKAQQSLTRFGSGPGSAGPGAPRFVSAESRAAGQNTIRWQTATDADDSELNYSIYRNGSSTPLGTVQASSLWWYLPQASFTDTTAAPGTRYSYQVRANDPDGHVGALSAQVQITTPTAAQAYPAAVRADGAETYWRLGDSFAAAADSSATNRMGLPFGTPGIGAATGALSGDTNRAATFDGTDDVVYAQQRIAAPKTFSAEAWFRTDTTTGGKIFGFGNGQPRRNNNAGLSSSYDRHVYMTNGGNLVFGVWTGSAQTVVSPGTYNDNVWHHVVATQGADGMVLYVDGLPVGANSVTGNEAITGSWRIGGDQLGSTWPQMPGSRYFKGSIDEFAVYPTALSEARTQAHYVAGGGILPTPEPVPDTTPPSQVEGTAAAFSGSGVKLGWAAGTDNVAVTGYQIHRSAADGFTPSTETLLTTVPGTELAHEDKEAAAGTYYYRIIAVDAAGNVGPASAQASATVPAAVPDPVTLTLTPAEDSYANQGAPNAVNGTSTSLASRGSPGYTSYLRFRLGAGVPDGMRLQSATLRLYTTTESFAGSLDQHTIHAVTGNWSEGTVTWNNRPSLASALLGTVSPVAVNTPQTVNLDPEAVAAMLTGSVDLGITSAGTDNAWFYAREASSTRRPVLTLVFAP